MRAPLLYNPSAGAGRLAARLQAARARFPVEPIPLRGVDGAAEQARELAREAGLLLVAGGDGTLHHVLAGVAESGVPLGLVPGGTGNDFAAALGIPGAVDASLRAALDGTPQPVDLAFAAGRPFAGIAGVGIVADVLTYLERASRRLGGRWVYPWAVLRTLATHRPLRVELRAGNETFEGPVTIALVANSDRFGGGMRAAPGARLDDGLLDVVVLEAVPRTTLARLLPAVYRGTHVHHPACRTFRAPRVRLGGDDARLYADGEPMQVRTGDRPEIEVRRGALLVLR